MKTRDRVIKWLWYGGVFLFMYLWFSQVHPLVVFDADDWGHISYTRSAIPDLSKWNPAKLFPEIVMSLTSTIAAFTIFPIVGDYILSITVMSALVVSSFITLYVYCLGGAMKRMFSLDIIKNIYIQLLFLVSHFLTFRNGDSGNLYLFHCADLTCYYNYLLPALLNAALVLYMIGNEDLKCFLKHGDFIKRGLFYVVVYFAVFSNLVDSIIFVSYIGLEFLLSFVESLKHKENVKVFLIDNSFHLGVLCCWVVALVFELLGGRAAIANSEQISLNKLIGETLIHFNSIIFRMHKIFILVLIILVLAAILLIYFRKEKSICEKLLFLAILIAGMFVFTIVISAKVKPSYVGRSEYVFGLFFYVLLFEAICTGIIMKKIECSTIIAPLAICIMASFINTNLDTFAPANQLGQSEKLCAVISKDLVTQVVDADRSGKNSVSVEVTYSGGDNNWPQAVYMGEYVSSALYKHGVVNRKIDVTIVPSVEYNEKYGVYQ